MYEPMICGKLTKRHQRVEVAMGDGEIMRRIDANWSHSPSRAVVKLPFSYRPVKLTRRDAEEPAVTDENEWITSSSELSACRLYCLARSLKEIGENDCCSDFRLPYDVNIDVGHGKAIPARVSLSVSYRAEINSPTRLVRAFSDRESLSCEELHRSIYSEVAEGCSELARRVENRTLRLDGMKELLLEDDLILGCEKSINGALFEKGISMEKLAFSFSMPFNRMESNEWTKHLENERMLAEMNEDAETMKKYLEMTKLAEELENRTEQEPQGFDALR